MNDKTLSIWLRKYNELEERSCRYDRLIEKREEKGELERAKRLSHLNDEIMAQMKGMREALNIFGYDVDYQDEKFVIVESN